MDDKTAMINEMNPTNDMLSGRLYLVKFPSGLYSLQFAQSKDMKDIDFEATDIFVKWESDIIHSTLSQR